MFFSLQKYNPIYNTKKKRGKNSTSSFLIHQFEWNVEILKIIIYQCFFCCCCCVYLLYIVFFV